MKVKRNSKLLLAISLAWLFPLIGCETREWVCDCSGDNSGISQPTDTSAEEGEGGGGGGSGGEIDVEGLEKIYKKYDDCNYTYTGNPVTITMSQWDSMGKSSEQKVINTLLKGFNHRYPNITVKLDIVGQYEANYGTNQITAHTAHDVFMVPDGAFNQWVLLNSSERGDTGSGSMLDLTPRIESSELIKTDEMFNSVVKRYQFNYPNTFQSGHQYCIPKDVGTHVMFYNKDLLKKAEGLDSTIKPLADVVLKKDHRITTDEAEQLWSKIYALKSQLGINAPVTGLDPEGLVWSAGGDFLVGGSLPKSMPAVSTPEYNGLVKGYEFLQKMIKNGYNYFDDTADVATLFSTKKVVFAIEGNYNVLSFRKNKFDWDVAYVPAFTENIEENMRSGSVGYAINKYNVTANPDKLEAAWKLVEYIGSKEGQEVLAFTGFQIPTYINVASSEDVISRESALGPASYEIFVESAKKQRPGLWQYCRIQTWKNEGYDKAGGDGLYDKSGTLTVASWLESIRSKVNRSDYQI